MENRGKRNTAVMLVVLFAHSAFLAWNVWCHSPTFAECPHLAAGISHWQYGRFELYRVNPPLVRMVAALPVLVAGAEMDWRDFDEAPGARSEFLLGHVLVAMNGERSTWLVTLARWACIPFSVLGGYVCFRWARELFGDCAGVLALVLWCFSPDVLAHACLITPDVGASTVGVTAGYVFWKWLQNATLSRACQASLTLGLAELTKTTWLVLYPVWLLLWLVRQPWRGTTQQASKAFLLQTAQISLIIVGSIAVLNLGYGFNGSFSRLSDFGFVSAILAGPANRNSEGIAPLASNRFSQSALGAVRVPVPKDYLLGIDEQKYDFETFRRASFLRGQFRSPGWWYYYYYAMMVKVPLGTWVLFALALGVVARGGRLGYSYSLPWRDELLLAAPVLAVFTLVSSQTSINHHLRYALPAYPFLFIWISRLGRAFGVGHQRLSRAVVLALTWAVSSSLWIYPHSLSYFNELAGGPRNGHAHLLHSNIDWGQDLLYLRKWLDDHPEASPLQLVYYGRFDPRAAGIQFTLPPLPPSLSRAKPDDIRPRPGWYAISVNYLRGYTWHVSDGKGGFRTVPWGAFTFLQHLQPQATAGYSIYIYHVTLDDANRLRRELGMPELPKV